MMQNLLTLNNTTQGCDAYIAASAAVFSFIIYVLINLVDSLTIETVNMSDILDICLGTEEDDLLFEPSILFNNFRDKLALDMSTSSKEAMLINLNSVHLIVIHGHYVKYYLLTINPNLTLNIIAEGQIFRNFIASELSFIDAQFNEAINALIAIKGPMMLKITTVIWGTDYTLPLITPFIPLHSYMLSNPCSFLAFIYENNHIFLYLDDISANLNRLLSFRSYLSNECEHVLAMFYDVPSDRLAENSMRLAECKCQLIRYIEVIYNIYGHLDPLNTFVTRLMEISAVDKTINLEDTVDELYDEWGLQRSYHEPD